MSQQLSSKFVIQIKNEITFVGFLQELKRKIAGDLLGRLKISVNYSLGFHVV